MSQPATVGQQPVEDIQANLTFIIPQATKPYFESAALTGAEPRIHFGIEQREVTVHDMRAVADTLSLDHSGFELRRHETAVDDLYDNAAMDGLYRAELQDLLRDHTGADQVAVFDFTRRSDAPQGASNPDGSRGPADRVHVDYTVDSGPKRARDALGAATVDRVLAAGGRIAQVNVWRPIRGPVERAPLALGDASSIAPGELVATDQVFPDRVGEIYYISHGHGQRWYWAPRIQRDEIILIKGWDSLDDGRARFTPHGAFRHPHETDTTPARESIEARTYLIFNR